jgi:hypothetical protein
MKSTHEIIASGGWRVEKHRLRPKALWFTGTSAAWSAFWIIPAVAGIFDQNTQSLIHWLLTDWLGRGYGLCLLLHPVFIVLALIFWFTEEPRDVAIHRKNPDYDPRNLY